MLDRRKSNRIFGLSGVLRSLLCERGGAALVEFAFIASLLAALSLSGIELSRYVLLNFKLSRAAATASDLAARTETLSGADVGQIFFAMNRVFSPFELGSDGVVILSSVGGDGSANPRVNWQCDGGGEASESSTLGSVGGTANLPTGMDLRDDQNVIYAEIFFQYEPMIFDFLLDDHGLYYRTVHQPRFGALLDLSDGNCPAWPPI